MKFIPSLDLSRMLYEEEISPADGGEIPRFALRRRDVRDVFGVPGAG